MAYYGYDPTQFGAMRVGIMQQSAERVGQDAQRLGQDVGKIVTNVSKAKEQDAMLYSQASQIRTAVVKGTNLLAEYDQAAAETMQKAGLTSAINAVPPPPKNASKTELLQYIDAWTPKANGLWVALASNDAIPIETIGAAMGLPGLTEETRKQLQAAMGQRQTAAKSTRAGELAQQITTPQKEELAGPPEPGQAGPVMGEAPAEAQSQFGVYTGLTKRGVEPGMAKEYSSQFAGAQKTQAKTWQSRLEESRQMLRARALDQGDVRLSQQAWEIALRDAANRRDDFQSAEDLIVKVIQPRIDVLNESLAKTDQPLPEGLMPDQIKKMEDTRAKTRKEIQASLQATYEQHAAWQEYATSLKAPTGAQTWRASQFGPPQIQATAPVSTAPAAPAAAPAPTPAPAPAPQPEPAPVVEPGARAQPTEPPPPTPPPAPKSKPKPKVKPAPGGAKATTGTATNPYTVASDADYNLVPVGAFYVGPDGKVRRKNK